MVSTLYRNKERNSKISIQYSGKKRILGGRSQSMAEGNEELLCDFAARRMLLLLYYVNITLVRSYMLRIEKENQKTNKQTSTLFYQTNKQTKTTQWW